MQRLFSLFVLTTVCACTSVEVEYEYGKASFSGFGSKFAWVETPDEGTLDVPTEVLSFIRETIENDLIKKGYTKAAAAEADFQVAYRVSSKFAVARPHWELEQYQEGALDVFIMTPKSFELMWRGKARAAIDASLTPSQRRERLREGIAKMLANFPDQGKEAKR